MAIWLILELFLLETRECERGSRASSFTYGECPGEVVVVRDGYFRVGLQCFSSCWYPFFSTGRWVSDRQRTSNHPIESTNREIDRRTVYSMLSLSWLIRPWLEHVGYSVSSAVVRWSVTYDRKRQYWSLFSSSVMMPRLFLFDSFSTYPSDCHFSELCSAWASHCCDWDREDRTRIALDQSEREICQWWRLLMCSDRHPDRREDRSAMLD